MEKIIDKLSQKYNYYDTTYFPVAAVSCATFLSFYKFVSPKVMPIFVPSYSLLPIGKQIEWNSRTTSTLHAVLVSCVCTYILLYDEEVNEDPVWGDSPLAKATCAMVIGYMTADMIIIIRNYQQLGEVCYFFHHGASMYAYYFVMTYGALQYFATFRLVAEFSTPFVNQRWHLVAVGCEKSSSLFIGNAVAMTVIFFACRILAIPPYWYKVYTIYGTEAYLRLGRIQYVLIGSCLVLDTLNLYWFCKIFLGAKKFLDKAKMDKNKNFEVKAQ